MTINELTQESFDEAVAEGITIVDFWASWCGPCRMQSQILDEFTEKHEHVRVCKVDVEDERELARKYGVLSIPTVALFSDGALIEKRVGVQGVEALEDMALGERVI